MSEFSKYLDYLIKCRDLKLVQVAEICKVDTSTIFRWANGKVLPKSWERLEPVVKKLRLTPYEVSVLRNAYRKELLGESQGQCFEEIMKIFRILEQKQEKYQCAGQEKEWGNQGEREWRLGAGFCALGSKIEVWRHIQDALGQASRQDGQGLYLKLHDISDVLLMELKGLCSQRDGGRVSILICEGNGAANRAEEKLKQMRKILDLLFGEREIYIYYLDASDGAAWEGQNWIVSDGFFLQFSNDMSRGMATGDETWIAFFQERMGRLEERGTPIHKGAIGAMEYVERGTAKEGIQAAAVEYMPCVGMGLTEEILQDRIYKETPFREEMIQKILANQPNRIPGIGQLFSYFTREGLMEFMESGRVEIFPYKIYSPATLQQRCQVLANLIALAEKEPSIHYLMLKEGFLGMKGIYVEQRDGAGDSLRIELQFRGEGKEGIAILDWEIQQAYRDFFAYLKKSVNVYGEEETLACLREVLETYQRKEVS